MHFPVLSLSYFQYLGATESVIFYMWKVDRHLGQFFGSQRIPKDLDPGTEKNHMESYFATQWEFLLATWVYDMPV